MTPNNIRAPSPIRGWSPNPMRQPSPMRRPISTTRVPRNNLPKVSIPLPKASTPSSRRTPVASTDFKEKPDFKSKLNCFLGLDDNDDVTSDSKVDELNPDQEQRDTDTPQNMNEEFNQTFLGGGRVGDTNENEPKPEKSSKKDKTHGDVSPTNSTGSSRSGSYAKKKFGKTSEEQVHLAGRKIQELSKVVSHLEEALLEKVPSQSNEDCRDDVETFSPAMEISSPKCGNVERNLINLTKQRIAELTDIHKTLMNNFSEFQKYNESLASKNIKLEKQVVELREKNKSLKNSFSSGAPQQDEESKANEEPMASSHLSGEGKTRVDIFLQSYESQVETHLHCLKQESLSDVISRLQGSRH